MAQTLGLSIDVCPGLGISPLRTNIWLSLSQADLGPRSAQELFFSGFLKSLKVFFSKICAHSERYRNLLAGIFEIRTFYGNIAFLLSPEYEFFFVLSTLHYTGALVLPPRTHTNMIPVPGTTAVRRYTGYQVYINSRISYEHYTYV